MNSYVMHLRIDVFFFFTTLKSSAELRLIKKQKKTNSIFVYITKDFSLMNNISLPNCSAFKNSNQKDIVSELNTKIINIHRKDM
jgi:hypothetical protein